MGDGSGLAADFFVLLLLAPRSAPDVMTEVHEFAWNDGSCNSLITDH